MTSSKSSNKLTDSLPPKIVSSTSLQLTPNFSSLKQLNSSDEFISHRDDDDSQTITWGPNVPTGEESESDGRQIQTDPSSLDRIENNVIPDDFYFSKKKVAGQLNSKSVPSFRGTSWELWWVQSQLWNRGLVLLILIFVIFFIVQFVIGLFFLINSCGQDVEDPYVCRTEKCRKMSTWLGESMNKSVSPCDNYYEFMCGNHKGTDRGNLPFKWYDSFARLELDGESVLAKLLRKSNDTILIQMLEYYQACIDIRHREQSGLTVFSEIVKEIFNDFDLWDDTKEPRLEIVASRIVTTVGDYGMFAIREPINYPLVYYSPVSPDDWLKSPSLAGLDTIFPFIFDALDIPKNKRHEIKIDLLHMITTFKYFIYQKQPKKKKSCEKIQYQHYFDLKYPLWDVFLGNDSMETIPGTDNKQWKLKDGEKFQLELSKSFTGKEENFEAGFTSLFECWNSKMQRISIQNIRAVYATFWSLRILTEIENEIDFQTAVKYQLLENSLISELQQELFKRSIQSRCFESIQHKMGYLPIFSLFNIKKQSGVFDIDLVNKIINDSATDLLSWYLPPEEGGIPLMSSFYRERVADILSGREDTAILVPVREDDPTFRNDADDEYELETTDIHLRNVIIWLKYSLNRKVYFWKRGTPKGKLVWYQTFYQLDNVDVFETPGYAAYSIVKFPMSLFLFPYNDNDMMAADFAGSYYLSVKAWLKLIFFDHHEDNVKEDIRYKGKVKEPYREGTFSDGDYEKCESYHDGMRDAIRSHAFAFNYGLHPTDEWESVTDAYYISLCIKTSYKMFIKEKKRLAMEPYWKLKPIQRNQTTHTRLIGYEEYSDQHLFFMTVGRHFCRSRAKNMEEYESHVHRFLSAFMSLNEFSDTFKCPLGSSMNPPEKCIR